MTAFRVVVTSQASHWPVAIRIELIGINDQGAVVAGIINTVAVVVIELFDGAPAVRCSKRGLGRASERCVRFLSSQPQRGPAIAMNVGAGSLQAHLLGFVDDKKGRRREVSRRADARRASDPARFA